MFWSVVRTLARREAFAAERLQESGFETLLPRIRNGKSATPLFPGYLFVVVVDRWRAIDTTLGVLRLVRFGDQPAKAPDREIAALRVRMDEHGFVRLPPPRPVRRAFRKGDKVKIIGGPFEGVAALHSGMTAKERELVLITMLGSVRQVAVPAHLIVGCFR